LRQGVSGFLFSAVGRFCMALVALPPYVGTMKATHINPLEEEIFFFFSEIFSHFWAQKTHCGQEDMKK
jgi:hypothetical protein